MMFVNKLDRAATPVADAIAAMREQSERRMIPRQVPIRNGEALSGYVDLVHERAYRYRTGRCVGNNRRPRVDR